MREASTTYGRTESEHQRLELVDDKAVYYVSNRPEAYEVCGEIERHQARAIARAIAEQAAKRFPGIEFKVDDAWHQHQHGMEHVAAYIEANWQRWADLVLHTS